MIKSKILFLLIVISLLFVSCEEKHQHQWTTKIEKEAGCETKGLLVRTCPCGATEKEEIPATGHKEQVTKVKTPATCTTEGVSETVCSKCGKVFSTAPIPRTAHTPGEEVVVTEPTCTVKGKAEIKCSVCGALIEEKELPATGHKLLEAGKVVKKEATCTETGLEAGVCAICGETLKEVETPALGHDWGETVIITEATCTTEGKAQQTCKRCQATRDGVIEKKPHNFTGESKVTKEPTCTEKGEVVTKCANANCTATTISHTDALGHEFTIDKGYKKDANGNAIEPTQFRPGIKIYKCSRCDATEEKEVWDETVKHEHYKVTDAWAYSDSKNEYGRNVVGTCVTPAKTGVYCSCYTDGNGNFFSEPGEGRTRYFLGYHEGDKDPNNHVHTETVSKTANSYFYGSLEEKVCNDCKKLLETKINTEGKVSAVGRWKGEGTFSTRKEESYSYYFNHDISLFENGTSLISSSFVGESNGQTFMSGDYMEMNVQADKDNKLQGLNRAVNGAWVGKAWATDVYQKQDYNGDKKNFLYLNPVSKEYIDGSATLVMASCDVDKGIMNWDFFLDGTQLLELKKETLPEVKSVLTIANFNKSLIDTTFTEGTDGVYTVILPAGTTEITLEAVALVDTISGCTWYVNNKGRNDASATQTISVSTESTRVDVDVYVNGAKETHSAIFKVATN